MVYLNDIWRSLAGVAIFLLGMNLLEESLRYLAGRPFKLFLKKHTSNKLKAITGGAVVTGILQSSSIVNLMVLGFVGSGIIQTQNALGIILGSNLGSTVTNWIIAGVGFSFNPADFALPVTGISGVVMMISDKESRWYQWSRLIFGLSFLFVGLSFIQSGIGGLVQHVDLSLLREQPAIVFLLLGFVITSLIQSSSATMAIMLSALAVDAITLVSAMAAVLGAEVGTTIKLVLASLKGIPAKKRVAAGNLMFNGITTLLALLFIHPVNRLIVDMIGIRDNLIALVFFQSLVNFSGIILFFPFLEAFGRFLGTRFKGKDDEDLFSREVISDDEDAVSDSMEKGTRHLIFYVLGFTGNAFGLEFKAPKDLKTDRFDRKQVPQKYEYIKKLYGNMHQYFISVQSTPSVRRDRERLLQLISCIRNCMYAAKNIRDVLHDITQLKNSSNDSKFNFFMESSRRIELFCNAISQLMDEPDSEKRFAGIREIYCNVQNEYTATLQGLYKKSMAKSLSHAEISTMINFNRELYTAYKSFVFALKDFLLNVRQAKYFDNLPGFIR